eukprot:1637714-Amphidinium_carterae.1
MSQSFAAVEPPSLPPPPPTEIDVTGDIPTSQLALPPIREADTVAPTTQQQHMDAFTVTRESIAA